MIKNNQFGFTIVEVIMTVVIVGLLALVGWFVWDRQDKTDSSAKTPATATPSAAPEAEKVRITNYAECAKAPGSKVDVDKTSNYFSTCTTSSGVKFTPIDPSNFSDEGQAITLSGYDTCAPGDFGAESSTVTLQKLVDDWAAVRLQATCGDSLVSIYKKSDTGWKVVLAGHLISCSSMAQAGVPTAVLPNCFY